LYDFSRPCTRIAGPDWLMVMVALSSPPPEAGQERWMVMSP
jgi:hypothetical protein